jgi:membrane associated rhomboid family serine protease
MLARVRTGAPVSVTGVIPIRDDNPTRRVPIVTILLIVLNVGVFFLLQPQGSDLVTRPGETTDRRQEQLEQIEFDFEYAAIPCEITKGRPLTEEELVRTVVQGDDTACADQPAGRRAFPDKRVWLAAVVSMFLHANLVHLGGNMLFLWIFGNNIEDHLGAVRYALFYLAGGVVATLAHVAVQPDSTVPMIGASGAVAGVMGAYLLWFPNATILTAIFFVFILFRHIPAKWLLGFWFVSQFFVNPNEGVAWMAHVGGFVFGALVGLVVRASRAARRAAWTSRYTGPASDPWYRGGDDLRRRGPWD